MDKSYENLAIVIPSLDPTETLVLYVKALIAQGFMHIYIVNDGSTKLYEPIFRRISAIKECTLLTHGTNQGKGAALRTAFDYIAQHCPNCTGIITADSDGQHAVKDVCQIADSLPQYPEHLLMGGRDFSLNGVPFKSWLGNRISTLIFFLLHGIWVQDTQTGLRGFHTSLLQEMLTISGDRFEYEMAVLVTCANKKIPVHFVDIDTIYIDGNAASHFRPLVDSARIGSVLLAGLFRFMLSAGLCGIMDIGLCWMFLSLFVGLVPSNLLRIGLSVLLARILSMLLNYTINRGYVFGKTNRPQGSFGRYLLLAIANMLALTAIIYTGQAWLGISERLITVLANLVLFVINYQVQKTWVFPQP